ncbi:MAG: hypothetical protein EXS64_16290 [Candidatus Latescibacteria bacterium]|nr:hypothetical protein [Candidatus Latescibacterota bacterium]
MSLKAFHIFFIFVSTALSVGFGAWGVRDYLHSGDTLNLAMGVGAFAGGALLVWYSKWFLRKLKDVSYL